MPRLHWPVMFVLSAALLAACGASGGAGGPLPTPPSPSGSPPTGTVDPRAPHPLTVHVVPDERRTQTASIGPAGGTLTATATDGTVYTLTVPENALLSGHTLSLTPISRIQDLPLTGGFVGAVHLEPDGLQFLEPALLNITSPHDLDATHLRGFNAHGQGQEFYLQASSVDGHTVTLPLTHFSNPGAATVTDADLTHLIAPLVPTDPVDRQANDDVVASLLPDFSRIRPQLRAATGSDAALDLALRQFSWFRAEVRGLNSEGQANYQKDIYEGWTLIAQGIDASVQRASTACTAGNLDDVTKILRWVTWVKRNPRLTPYFNGRLNTYGAKAASCASFQVELESTYTIRHYLPEEGHNTDDWTSTHHVKGSMNVVYSVERARLEGQGTMIEDGYSARGYSSYFGPPDGPDCVISGDTAQSGPFTVESVGGFTSTLDLDLIVAPLVPDTSTTALNLALFAAPLEHVMQTCKLGMGTQSDGPLWSHAFSQMRDPKSAHPWEFTNLALQGGMAEVDLNDTYDGPELDAEGQPTDEHQVTVTGTTKVTVLHTPMP